MGDLAPHNYDTKTSNNTLVYAENREARRRKPLSAAKQKMRERELEKKRKMWRLENKRRRQARRNLY